MKRTTFTAFLTSGAITVAVSVGYLGGVAGAAQPAAAQSPSAQALPLGDPGMGHHAGSMMDAGHVAMMRDRAMLRMHRAIVRERSSTRMMREHMKG